MEATAHEHSPNPTTPPASRPALAIVPDRRTDPAHSARGKRPGDESRIGRAGMIGAAIGFAFICLTITIAGTLGGMEPISAFGFGAFVGFWGGSGFGFMTGASVSGARFNEDVRRDRSTKHDGGPMT